MGKIDVSSLEKSFNLDDIKYDIKALRDRIKNIDDYEDPSKILQENIIRASRLLDHLEDEIDLGITPKGGTSRMLEVATLLINSITTAATAMSTMSFGAADKEYKDKVLSLKELEVNAKLAGKTPQQALTQNNNVNIFTDRNSLLEMLREKNDPLTIETSPLKELE